MLLKILTTVRPTSVRMVVCVSIWSMVLHVTVPQHGDLRELCVKMVIKRAIKINNCYHGN